MGREDREHFLAGTGWDFGVLRWYRLGFWGAEIVPGLLLLLLCAEHTHSSSTEPLMLAQEPWEHLGVSVSHKDRKHTKAGAGR